MIRAAAAEMPAPIPLDMALDICLALLDLEPQTYPQTATRWGSRLAMERKLTLVDAQLAFAALAALPSPSARAGAEALIEISGRSLGTSFVSDLPCGRSGASSPGDCASRIRAGECQGPREK
jgi:hypothetical protein